MPPALADLETRLGFGPGGLSGAEAARAVAALDDATGLALAEIPTAVATAWQADAPRAAATIVLKAARREYENPQGLRSERLDGNGFTVDTATGVYLTENETAALRRLARGRSGGFVGAVRTPSAYSPSPTS